MTALRDFRSRVRSALTRRAAEARLGEEIQSHLDLLTEDFESRGLSPAAARIAARREFGGVEAIKDATRDERGFPFFESLAQDALFALRQLRRSPSFALTAIVTLAIGVGGTTAMFSVLDLVAIRPLPYPAAERLVTIQESLPQFGPFPVSAADATFWADHSSSFDGIALAGLTALNLTGAGEPERIATGAVTPNFLRLLGATTQFGRLLLDEEDQPGRDRVVVLSDALWRTRFNADPSIVGRTIQLSGAPYEVVGVLLPSFKVPSTKLFHSLPTREVAPQMWKPMGLPQAERPAIGRYSYASLARLRPGVSVAQAREELARVQLDLLREIPGKGNLRTVVVPLQEQLASRSRAGLELLLLVVAAVLTIGCANIANLLLARTVARRKEMSVREAIGAGRVRIARQVIVENIVLAAVGGLAGLAVAFGALQLIIAVAPADVPFIEDVRLDIRVLLFSAAVSIACGLLVGLAPAWRAGRSNVNDALKNRGAGDSQPGTARIRSALVTAEIGLTAAAVAVAVLLLQSFSSLLNLERGFDATRTLTLDVNLAGQRFQNALQTAAFIDAVVADIERAPETAMVAVSSQLPLTGTGSLSALSAEGTSVPPMERPSADVRSVSPDFFQTIALPLKTGRLIEATDRERNVAVLSEQLAARGWPGENPIGRRFRFGVNPAAPVYEVIGTVGDVRGATLDQPVTPTAYVPFPQRISGGVSLMVKSRGEPMALAPIVRQSIRAHDVELPIGAFRTMDDVVEESVATRRFQLMLVAFFAILAALLACVGVYGVMAYSVEQRRREIGIRLALGERPKALVARIMREALVLAAGGLLIAVAIAAFTSSFLRGFLVGVTPYNPLVIAATISIVGAAAIVASAGPSLRATRIDPMGALRSE